MKKSLFLGAAALLALASCSNEETVEAPKGNAISFGKAFVNNSTRGGDAIVLDNLTQFNVYGYMNAFTGGIFDGTLVTKGADAWTYEGGLRYWTADNNYAFAAIAPVTATYTYSTEGATFPAAKADFGTITFTNDGTKDLIYASQFATGLASGNQTVNFQFNHLLSRVMFTFNNEIEGGEYTISVEDIKVTGVYENGSIALGENAKWTPVAASNTLALDYTAATASVEYGKNTITDAYFFIPANVEYKVSFTVKTYTKSGALATTAPKTATLPAVDMLMGYSYNFTTTFTAANVADKELEPIVFDVVGVDDFKAATPNDFTFE